MSTNAPFTVSLNQTSAVDVAVHYSTRDGTAVAGADYTATSGTLVIPAGSTSGTVNIVILTTAPPSTNKLFYVDLTAPLNGVIIKATGTCTITEAAASTYLERHITLYSLVTTTNKLTYFGPQSGVNANKIPYHAAEKLIVEGPDYGHETTSETASFWVKLEAYHLAAVPADATAYNNAWTIIDQFFVPSSALQPTAVGNYDPTNPATFQPNENTLAGYPVPVDNQGSYNGTGSPIVTGADPIYAGLIASYATSTIYLMHWEWDVDGDYGFHNGDGGKNMVAINNYSRGLSESVWLAVMHPEWEDFTNGGAGAPQGGFSGLYKQPGAGYSKQYSYTCAPDGEARAVGAAYVAYKAAAANGLNVATATANAKKMGDYQRYALYDKYFQPIGMSSGKVSDGSGCHYLNSWYVAWGGGDPSSGPSSDWAFRIGSSEIHFGYNNVDAAYAMAMDFSPITSGAQAQWQTSLHRQLELIRWLQTPEGPIAGGVSNSWYDRYEHPGDGRDAHCFYGMYYTYSPVWHNPRSNSWIGYQIWGLERVAKMCLQAAGKTDGLSTSVYSNAMVILDRFINWLLTNTVFDTALNCTLPGELVWASSTQVAGKTTTSPNLEGVYEYIPSLDWDSSGDYGAFWNAGTVPNPNLKAIITGTSNDNGLVGCMAQLLIQYTKAKLVSGGALANTIPGGSFTLQTALTTAQKALDGIWANSKDFTGVTFNETRADYSQFNISVYIPPGYGIGTMPNGDTFSNGDCTFISIRSFMKEYPGYDKVQAYLDGGAAPVFQYHRFWTQVEVITGLAMMAIYFPTVSPTNA